MKEKEEELKSNDELCECSNCCDCSCGHQEKNEIKELEDKFLRLQAEFDNYHKRTDKEIEKLKKTANKELILDLLEFLDELEESMKHIKEDKNNEKILKGLEMIHEKLLLNLKKRGLEEIECKEFDPYKHEALMYEKGKDGEITKVLKKGYLLNGEIIRHACVCIGKNEEVDLNE
ncbi:MAG: nucleotide exchange factor GrpE [Candidatus Micrarchaeia archaeon]|jgi:molecular chaperone GrpE